VREWRLTAQWLVAAQGAARALGLLNNVLLARLLAPLGYGSFTQAMAHAGALAPLADMGVAAILCRHVARRGDTSQLLGAAVALRLFQGAGLVIVAALSAWWIYEEARLHWAVLIASAYWSVASVQQLLAGVARARAEAYLEARAVMLERTAAIMLAAGGAYWFGLWGALTGVLVAGMASLLYLWRRLPLPAPQHHWRVWKRLLWAGVPLAVADVCHGLIMRLDILAVGMRYGAQSAGWYGSASVLLWASNLVAGSMALALIPASVARRNHSGALGLSVLRWMLATATALALVLAVGAPLWVSLLYGRAYQPAASVLRWLAWCLVPAAVVAWGNAVLLVRHRTAWVGAVALGGVVCMAVCLSGWLPRYGLVGASYAQVMTQCIMAVTILMLILSETSFGKRGHKKRSLDQDTGRAV
jgi:O-antigen/teichoic acid export membrane protein